MNNQEKINICKHAFSADIAEVFNIVTANVYQNHEVFLRELISNSSDACEKLFLEASKDSSKTGVINRSDLKIQIIVDKKNKKLVISDNGIGMNSEDLIANLGTIASSGTKKFFKEKLDGKKSESNLIGQFGIGFYSAFLVSDEVSLRTKKFDDEKIFEWNSKGVYGFEISELEKDSLEKWRYEFDGSNSKNHGTEIVLHLKEGEDQYLEKYRIKHLVETYSRNVPFDIILKEIKDEESSSSEENSDKSEILNEEKAIWMKNKNEITQEEYNKFFSKLSGVWGGEPWDVMHSRVEGESNYTYLFFIPKSTPFNFADPDRKTSIKLHVNKIFVTEDSPIIPKYLRFIKGIVDSYDLPLNVSRETVQQSYLIQRMNNYLTKKIISELKFLMNNEEKKNEYRSLFWPNFGSVLKEGLCEPLNTESRENILDVCLFSSSKRVDSLVSLAEYVDAMPANQEEIFYLTGSSLPEMMRDPQLEGFLEKGIEVLLLSDGVDDFWTNVVFEHKGKKFKSISLSDIDLEKISGENKGQTEEEKKDTNELSPVEKELIKFFKFVLGGAVKDVVISKKLSSSPACLGISEGGMNMKMERFLIDQKQIHSKTAKILEINKNHPLIVKISEAVSKNSQLSSSLDESNKNLNEGSDEVSENLENSKNSSDEAFEVLKAEFHDKIWNLFDFVSIIQGEDLFDSKEFSRRASKILEEIV
jgi:molecular chaperone HtpG